MTNWVQIAVPEDIVEEFALRVADHLRSQAEPKPRPEPEFAWDEASLGRLAAIINPHLGRMLDFLADQPGRRVTFDEVQAEIRVHRKHLRAMLGGGSNQIKSVFGMNSWPMDYDTVRGVSSYSMDADTAALWKRVRAA